MELLFHKNAIEKNKKVSIIDPKVDDEWSNEPAFFP